MFDLLLVAPEPIKTLDDERVTRPQQHLTQILVSRAVEVLAALLVGDDVALIGDVLPQRCNLTVEILFARADPRISVYFFHI